MNKALPFLNSLIPDNISEKALSKINSKFKNYFSSAAKGGIGTGAALAFLRNQFSDSIGEAEKNRLNEGVNQGTLRPDERAAAKELDRGDQKTSIIRNAAIGAGAFGAGTGLLGAAGSLIGGIGSGEKASTSGDVAGTTDPLLSVKSKLTDKFPQLLEYIQDSLQHGFPLELAIEDVKSQKEFSDVIRAIEDSGLTLEEFIRRELGDISGQQIKRQNAQKSQEPGEGAQRLIQILQSRPRR